MSNPDLSRDLTRDLSRHLTSYVTGIEAAPDPEGLRSRMQRVDRHRRIRTVGAAGSMIAVLAFGIFSLGGGESASQLDVRGETPEPPADPGGPDLGPSSTAEADGDGAADHTPDPTPVDSDASDPPTHLQSAPATTTPVAPAEVSTTAPPVTAPAVQSTTTTSPPATTVPPTTSGPVSFSAVAKYGSCEEDPPYDEYSGSAAPGATITITSPWSATVRTVADGDGYWYLRVEFPSAPVGTNFTVTASDGTNSTDMSFVRLV